MARGICVAAATILSACATGPVSVEQAMTECADRARAAARPTGNLAVGVGTGGPSVGLRVGVTSDFLAGRSPEFVYDDCVRRKSGVAPTRPLEFS